MGNTMVGKSKRMANGTGVNFRLAGAQVISTARDLATSETHEFVSACIRGRIAMDAAPTRLAGLTDSDIDSMLATI
jgi:hypothetical protein